MYLFNIFADLVDSRGILGQVWFIVLISVLAFCVLIVGLFVCIYMCKTNVTKRFLKNQDMNVRMARLDFNARSVYLADSKNYQAARSITYEDYLSTYGPKDRRNVQAFLSDVVEEKKPVGSYLLAEAVYSKDKKKKKHKNLLVVTNVNSKNKLVHFSAYTLPNLTENGNKEKPKKDRGYLDYEDYLMNFRGILSEKKQAAFYCVSLKSAHDDKGLDYITPILYRMIDKVCIHLKKNRYVIKIDDESFMIIDLNEKTSDDIRKLGDEIMDICEGFLGINSLKGEVILLVGVTARKEKEPIKALKRYVDEAKAASVSGESKDNFKNSKNKASILKKYNLSAPIYRVLKNKTWRISFTPFFKTDGSKTDTYLVNMEVYGEENLNINEFFYECADSNHFDEAMEKIVGDISPLLDKKNPDTRLVLPIDGMVFGQALDYFTKKPPKEFKLTVALLYNFSSHTNTMKFIERIKKANKVGVSVMLFFRSTSIPSITVETLSLLDGYVIEAKPELGIPSVNEERIKFYSMIRFLEQYNKEVLVYGLKTLEEMQLVCTRPVNQVTCLELENSSSRLEIPTEEEMKEFKSYIQPYPNKKYVDKINSRV